MSQPPAAGRAGSAADHGDHSLDLVGSRGDSVAEESPSAWEQRRVRVALELERIAVALFAEHGYQHVSYDDVAAAAGVSARTVYRYFPAKEEFVLAFVRRSAAEIEMGLGQLERTRHPINDVIELIMSLSEVFRDSLDDVIVWRQAVSSDREAESRVQGEQAILLERLLLDFCLDSAGETVIDVMSARAVAATIVAITSSVFRYWVECHGEQELSLLYGTALDAIRTSVRRNRTTTGMSALPV